ncbi:hypothetical protein KAJ27_15800 [bacterium]|nr:hypothetical protein [bacterium]
MVKIAFKASIIFVIIGILLVAYGQLLQVITPKIGWMVFKSAGTGSYNPQDYILNLSSFFRTAYFCIITGLVFSVFFYTKGRKLETS